MLLTLMTGVQANAHVIRAKFRIVWAAYLKHTGRQYVKLVPEVYRSAPFSHSAFYLLCLWRKSLLTQPSSWDTVIQLPFRRTIGTFYQGLQTSMKQKPFRIVEAMLVQRNDVGKTEYIVFNVQIGNDTPRYFSFERVWSDMSPWDFIVNLDTVYLDNHNHLLATLTFPHNEKPFMCTKWSSSRLLSNTTPTSIPAPFGIHIVIGTPDCRLLMNRLEEEHQLEVQAVPLRSYQNGIGAYTIYNRAQKDVLQVVLDDYVCRKHTLNVMYVFSCPSSVLPIISHLISC